MLISSGLCARSKERDTGRLRASGRGKAKAAPQRWGTKSSAAREEGALSKGRGSALILGCYFTRNPRSVRLPNGIYAHLLHSGGAFGDVWPREDKKGPGPWELLRIPLPPTSMNKVRTEKATAYNPATGKPRSRRDLSCRAK